MRFTPYYIETKQNYDLPSYSPTAQDLEMRHTSDQCRELRAQLERLSPYANARDYMVDLNKYTSWEQIRDDSTLCWECRRSAHEHIKYRQQLDVMYAKIEGEKRRAEEWKQRERENEVIYKLEKFKESMSEFFARIDLEPANPLKSLRTPKRQRRKAKSHVKRFTILNP